MRDEIDRGGAGEPNSSATGNQQEPTANLVTAAPVAATDADPGATDPTAAAGSSEINGPPPAVGSISEAVGRASVSNVPEPQQPVDGHTTPESLESPSKPIIGGAVEGNDSQQPEASEPIVTQPELDSNGTRGDVAQEPKSEAATAPGPAGTLPLGEEKKSPQPSKASPASIPPGAAGPLNPERLRFLADEISRNVGQVQTEEVARLRTVTAALELAGAVRPPPDAIMSWFTNMSIVSAVRVFQSWRVFDTIPAGKGESISYADLAAKVDTEEAFLIRMSWMLSSTGVLRHIDPGRVAHTPTSMMLRENETMGSMFKIMCTNVVDVSTILPAYFDTYGRREPLGPAHIPTSFLAGRPELEYFELLNEDPNRIKLFMCAMAVAHRRVPTIGMYDMSWVLQRADQDPGRLAWVDVGGGNGHTVKVFREAYPGLRANQCAIQDLPEVLNEAQTQAESDDALRGVSWIPMNFHKDVPVKGALIYYLRHIARDYSDPVFTTILRNVAGALAPDSRVLVSEQLLAGTPPPVYAAFKDYAMLSLGGKERTLDQFGAVAAAAGLRVSGVFRDQATPHAVVEFALQE
ncbi:S-adenosyl-L-methionine-dependent methyltransferase [Lasiosphaeria miniovina]|uniref:S-adenosyl-L-methionine-dependent methyltransferase n=1 Tax=Lasiosphaeria miniovina TaxID=1954250 RepID=A0AA40ALD1_9PEZI|nr:S-adenosyl-L-methionine-dependent methyltransferase [Lasiosphaeria miniovina]KAK0717962.1 S-adenosyl-L-methionine-dependent methyltransferase [Lasiosphaeria miniovina]